MDYNYIVVYNAESDFVGLWTREETIEQIEALAKDGYGTEDMDVYKVVKKFATVQDIKIKLEGK